MSSYRDRASTEPIVEGFHKQVTRFSILEQINSKTVLPPYDRRRTVIEKLIDCREAKLASGDCSIGTLGPIEPNPGLNLMLMEPVDLHPFRVSLPVTTRYLLPTCFPPARHHCTVGIVSRALRPCRN